MARKPRIHLPGGFFHVIQRGNARQPIFLFDEDRGCLLRLLEESVYRFGYRIHSFCLMTNHFHLVVQVGKIALSKIMHNIESRYTQWFNRRYTRVGHLFQGRYRAILVEDELYLLKLIQYIHLNPVRAKLVASPKEYQWSSHRAYLNGNEIPWLTQDHALGILCPNQELARELFIRFVDQGTLEITPPELHRAFSHGSSRDSRILASDAFIDCLRQQLRLQASSILALDSILLTVSDEYEIPVAEITTSEKRAASEARAVIALIVTEEPLLRLTCLAGKIGREVSALSHLARRLAARALREQTLALRIETVRQRLRGQA